MNNLITIGIITILVGIALFIIGSLIEAKESRFAVGGFIGPIPFGFGNDKTLLYFIIALTALVFVFWAIMNLVG